MPLFFNSAAKDKKLMKIPIGKISPNPYQPRKYFDSDAINSLADSISKHGIIQPVTVRQKDGGYELVAGERRLRAARIAGLAHIPCIVIRAGEKRSAELALTENLQRRDLDIFEEALAIEQLLSAGNMTQTQLADDLCMSQSSVANKLRLLRLDEQSRHIIRKHGLSERHARALLRVPPEKRCEIAEKIGSEGLSVTAAEEYIDTVICTGMAKKELSKKPPLPKARSKSEKTEELAEIKEEQKPIRRFLIGDLTLFFNSLDRSLSMLRCAGFAAELERSEQDDKIMLSITLKKSSEKQN